MCILVQNILLTSLIICYTYGMTTTMQDATTYVPGVCNINHKEIAYRRNVGYAGAAIFVIMLGAIIGLSLTSYLKLALFLPALIGAAGFVQAQAKFCVAYGAAGQHNAEEGSKAAQSITDKAALATDKLRTAKLKNNMFVYAAIATLVALAIPPYQF
jgi:hypothetical protein